MVHCVCVGTTLKKNTYLRMLLAFSQRSFTPSRSNSLWLPVVFLRQVTVCPFHIVKAIKGHIPSK